MAEDNQPETPDLISNEQIERWITVAGQKIPIKRGETLDEAIANRGRKTEKASYMTASQESPTKLDLQTTPHYVMTANELQQSTFNARVGEDVRYNSGVKKGILITVDRSIAKILNESRTGYDFAHISDVHKSDEFTVYGMWIDIPDYFRAWMLKKAKVGDPDHFIHKRWEQLPKELRAVLRDESLYEVRRDTGAESVFEETARTGQHANPTAINGYDGAKETEHEKIKHADGKNPYHRELEGLSGNLGNPNDNKRRDGRQVPDNEEQNNTFSAGEEKPNEPYSVNITGGSSHTQDYGTQLTDWRYAEPKPFKDVEQNIKPKKKVDSGDNAYSGENKPLNEEPHVSKSTFGIPEVKPQYGVRYVSKEEAEEWMKKNGKKREHKL